MKIFNENSDEMPIPPGLEITMVPQILKEAVMGLVEHWPELGVRVKMLSFGHAYQLMTSDKLENFRDVEVNLGKLFSSQTSEVFFALGSEQMGEDSVSMNLLFKSSLLIFILQIHAPVWPITNRNFQRYGEAQESAESAFAAGIERFSTLAKLAQTLTQTGELPKGVRLCYVHSDFAEKERADG
jgi:hypothetical protein